jgi:hypothetical protein
MGGPPPGMPNLNSLLQGFMGGAGGVAGPDGAQRINIRVGGQGAPGGMPDLSGILGQLGVAGGPGGAPPNLSGLLNMIRPPPASQQQ